MVTKKWYEKQSFDRLEEDFMIILSAFIPDRVGCLCICLEGFVLFSPLPLKR